METDINKVIRSALSTGKVLIGTKQTLSAVKEGKAQIVVLSTNCPDEILNNIKDVPIVRYPESSAELGAACGKPFSIASLVVIEPGDSSILSLKV